MTTEYAEDTTRVNEHYTEINGRELHVIGGTDDIEVWLNTEVTDFDGICIGGGESRRAAVEDAIETLELALGILGDMKAPNRMKASNEDLPLSSGLLRERGEQ